MGEGELWLVGKPVKWVERFDSRLGPHGSANLRLLHSGGAVTLLPSSKQYHLPREQSQDGRHHALRGGWDHGGERAQGADRAGRALHLVPIWNELLFKYGGPVSGLLVGGAIPAVGLFTLRANDPAQSTKELNFS